jgi:uncharacterized repeat protein (TIGR01451 family)
MRRNSPSQSGRLTPRALLASMFCVLGTSLALISFAQAPAGARKTQPHSPDVITVPGFHAAVSMPGSNAGTEPSLAIPQQLRAGLRFVTWQNPGEIATSLDGVNFANRGTRAGGGDVTNAADPSGSLFFTQFCSGAFMLHACFERSPDGGATWPLHTDIADMHPGAADRPWLEVFPHKRSTLAAAQAWNPDNTRVYLEYHTFSPEELAYVTVSADGGHTFSEAKLITSDTNALVASGCNTVPGGIGIDEATGTVYALWLSGNDVASSTVTGCNYSQIGPFNKAWVSRSTDGGNTWIATLAWQGALDLVTKIGDNASKIFATLSVDQAGQVHVVLPIRHNDDPLGFATNCQTNPNCEESPNDTDLLLVTSPDQGAHWTLPVSIENSSGSYFFPWTAAGSQGIVNTVYYKSATRQPNKPNSVWFVGHTRVTAAIATYTSGPNATYNGTPQFTETLLDTGPISGNGTSGGGICTFGLFCTAVPGSNRNLADSLAVTLDPAGGVNAVWTDNVGNPNGAKEIHFTCQNSGPSSFAGAPDLNGCYGPTDMSVTKSDSPDPVARNGTLTYHLTITNNGTPSMPATTSGVTLTDVLPAEVAFVSATPSTGSCSGTGTVVCNLGIFPSGATASVDIVVIAPNVLTTLTNTAVVAALTDDPDVSNNTATTVTTVGSPSAVSRKIHGPAGPFDIDLPVFGPPGIECRSGGASGVYQMVVRFVNPVALNSASVTSGVGSVSSTTVSGREVFVNLTGIANAQTIGVTLFGANDGGGPTNVVVPMSVLVGDTDASKAVNSTDVSQTKLQSGTAASPGHFRTDVTANGLINSSDVATVKIKSGTALP